MITVFQRNLDLLYDAKEFKCIIVNLNKNFKCVSCACKFDLFIIVCADKLPLIDCTTTKYLNGTCYNGDQFLGLWNDTMFTEVTGHKRISAAEEYWTLV